jgi:hypothetical protein
VIGLGAGALGLPVVAIGRPGKRYRFSLLRRFDVGFPFNGEER